MSNQQRCWKNEQHLNINLNFDLQMSLSKSKYWQSNNCLHFKNVLLHWKVYKSGLCQVFHFKLGSFSDVIEIHDTNASPCTKLKTQPRFHPTSLSLSMLTIMVIILSKHWWQRVELGQGGWHLTGEKIKVLWVEFPTLSWAVLVDTTIHAQHANGHF